MNFLKSYLILFVALITISCQPRAVAPVTVGTTEYIYNEAGNVTTIIRGGKVSCEMCYDENVLLKDKVDTMFFEDFAAIKIVTKYSYSFWQ